MRITTQLKIISTISIVSIALLSGVTVWSIEKVNRANEDLKLATEIKSNFFERTSIRDQYYIFREDRLRNMWNQRAEKSKSLLSEAKIRIHDEQSQQVIEQLLTQLETIKSIFARIVDNIGTLQKASERKQELEKTIRILTSQHLLKSDDYRDLTLELESGVKQRVDQSYQQLLVVLGISGLILAILVVIFSLYLSRLINKGLKPLHDGADLIASGNLEYKLQVMGSNEFHELSESINKMKARLIEEILLHQEKEARLRIIVENELVGIATVKDRIIQWANPAYERMLGYAKGELNGIAARVIYRNDEDYKAIGEKYLSVVNAGKVFRTEYELLRKDGRTISVDLNGANLNPETGESLWINSDITERKQAELKLRENERNLREAQTVGRIGSYIFDIVRDVWESSPVMDEIFGIGLDYPRTLAGWTQVLHPSEREQINSYFREIIAEHRRFEREYRIVRIIDGVEHWVLGLGEIEYDESGAPTLIRGIVQDITERKVNERKLFQSQQLLEGIVENIPAMVFVKRASDLRMELFNSAGEKLLGYSRNDVLGTNNYDLYPKEQGDWFTAADRKVLASDEVTEIQEEPIQTASGETRYLHTWKLALRDGNNEPTHLLGISLDITEYKRASAALKANEERLRMVLDATSDGLWDWDLRSGLSYLSPRYYEMSGYLPENVTPDFEFFKRLIHPDDLPHVLKTMEAHIQGKTPTSEIEYRMVMASGEIRWISGKGRVIKRDAEGAPLRMLGTIADITVRKQNEEVLRLHSAILENLAEGVYLIRQSDGVIVFANTQFERMFGYESDELLGKHVSIVNAPTKKSAEVTATEIMSELALTGIWKGEVQNIRGSCKTRYMSEFVCFL